MTDKQMNVVGRLVVSTLLCALGGLCLYLTQGKAGFGWTVLGLFVVWGC